MKKGKTLEPGLLASDSDWHNNACLNYMPDHGTAYTEGYRRAADILINHIDESGRDQDFLVYPVLFLYRHHLELLIKQIIGLALALAEDPDKHQYKKDDHNLNNLWPLAQKLILEVDDSYRPSDFKIVKEVVKALHQADERATDFRYARRNDGTRSLEDHDWPHTFSYFSGPNGRPASDHRLSRSTGLAADGARSGRTTEIPAGAGSERPAPLCARSAP